MKIGIDVTQLNYLGTGVANYTYQLVKHLLLIDKKNEYRLFYSSFRQPNNFYLNELKSLGAKIYSYRFPPYLLRIWWGRRSFFPIDWFTGYCHIFFFSDFLRPPLSGKTKGITTIHDLTWKLYPKFHKKNIIKTHQIKLEKTIKYGDEIIVDSKNTKKDLLTLYPQIKEKKVHVIYPGVDERFKPIKDKQKIKKVLKKYLSLKNRKQTFNYFLYVGAIEPRKNLDRAIEVFHQFQNNRHLTKTTNYKLLIIGQAGWKNEYIFKLVKKLKLKDKVVFVGFVEDEDLPYFYSGAKVTFYLSSYEGFGLPPLESAKCQTPVLLYQNSSLKELFNNQYPYAKEKEELKTLKYLLEKKINPERYLKNEFSWEKTANKILKLFENDF